MYKVTKKYHQGFRVYSRYLKSGKKVPGSYIKKFNKVTKKYYYRKIYNQAGGTSSSGSSPPVTLIPHTYRASLPLRRPPPSSTPKPDKKQFKELFDWLKEVHESIGYFEGSIETDKFKKKLRKNLRGTKMEEWQLIGQATYVAYSYHNATMDILDNPVDTMRALSANIYTSQQILDSILKYTLGCNYDVGSEKRKLYKTDKYLGSGTYGDVYSAEKDGNKYALKYLKFENLDHLMSTLVEIEALKKLSYKDSCSEYIACLHDYFCVHRRGTLKVALILELVPGFELSELFKKTTENYNMYFSNSPFELAEFFLQLALGLQYMHKKNIVHFDIKEDNIRFYMNNSGKPTPKYLDFGISCTPRLCHIMGADWSDYTITRKQPDTPNRDPLLLNYDERTPIDKLKAVDVYALGRLYEMMLHYMGVQEYTGLHQLAKSMRNQKLEDRPTIDKVVSQLHQIKKYTKNRDFGDPRVTEKYVRDKYATTSPRKRTRTHRAYGSVPANMGKIKISSIS